MDKTVFLTVLSGVLTYVLGQLVLKLVIEPVQDMKKTIGDISHSLIEHANVISNPGLPKKEVIAETSSHLRKLSSKIQSHLYLVPLYPITARIFRLPQKEKILEASKYLIGLSNSVFSETNDKVYESNAKRVERICDGLGIYMSDDDRWPRDG